MHKSYCCVILFFHSYRADIVSHLPPTTMVLPLLQDDYIHVQTEFFIDGEDRQRFCNQNVYEDPTCSMSLGPIFSVLDHATYFDTDTLATGASNPLAYTSLPWGIFEPTESIPALPKAISNFTSAVVHFATGLLSPVFG